MKYIALFASLVGAWGAAAPAAAQDRGVPRLEALPPAPPAGAAANLVIPVREPDGSYRTPVHAVSPAEAVWHVRSALNVAALGCRDAQEARTIAAYNAFIAHEAPALAAADRDTQAVYRSRFGAAWQDRHDAAMTRVYNFFAQPPAHESFCVVAEQILDESQDVAPEAFGAFAQAALARLETPFTVFYAQYESYRVALANWQGSSAVTGASAMAVSAPVSTDRAVALSHFGPE